MRRGSRRCRTRVVGMLLFLWSVCVASLPFTPNLAQTVQAQTGDSPDIFGGREAEVGAWPWQAALVTASQPDAYLGHYCGGTLIAPDWVLTAAHCVDTVAPEELNVVLGRHRLSSDEGERIATMQIYVHPNFNYAPFSPIFNLDADLALIRLATPSIQQPVTLYQGAAGEEETHYVGATITGWGTTEQVSSPDALREVEVPIVAHEACTQEYFDLVTQNMICAGHPKGNKDACYGDSGGPLIVHSQEAGGWRQIGIVSWGQGCGYAGAPSVYTRVSSFTSWINACLVDAASQTCLGTDAYEPDDQPQQATLLQSDGSSQPHNFHHRSDQDWFTFEAQAGSTYHIEAQPMGDLSDPIVWLYDSDGMTPLAYNDDSGGSRTARLSWHAPASATYYVAVQDLTSAKGERAAYTLVLQDEVLIYLPRVAP